MIDIKRIVNDIMDIFLCIRLFIFLVLYFFLYSILVIVVRRFLYGFLVVLIIYSVGVFFVEVDMVVVMFKTRVNGIGEWYVTVYKCGWKRFIFN